ncbi:hypothetical protein SRB521_01966 [Intestinimonas butyriciproducens]|nr:hypothetical protein SRB521_01966 [Intestinimonas butyriciproducens]
MRAGPGGDRRGRPNFSNSKFAWSSGVAVGTRKRRKEVSARRRGAETRRPFMPRR